MILKNVKYRPKNDFIFALNFMFRKLSAFDWERKTCSRTVILCYVLQNTEQKTKKIGPRTEQNMAVWSGLELEQNQNIEWMSMIMYEIYVRVLTVFSPTS